MRDTSKTTGKTVQSNTTEVPVDESELKDSDLPGLDPKGVDQEVMMIEIIQLIAKLLRTVGTSFKRVGGEFVDQADLERFVWTLFALSSIGPYDTQIVVKGVSYSLSDYQVDSRIGNAFMQPRAIMMPGTSPFRRDVSAALLGGGQLAPAEFLEFQYKFLNYFKTVPSLGNILEFIKVVNIGEVTDCMHSKLAHVEDLASTKKIPYILRDVSLLYEPQYFQYSADSVVRMVVTNFYSDLK